MYVYQTMDDFLFTSTPLFSKPPVFIGNDQYITSNSSFPNEIKYTTEINFNPEPSINVEFINQYQTILNMKDEDDETEKIKLRIATAERKEQTIINRERANLEKLRQKQLNSPLSKHLAKCKSMRKELIEKGFSEEDSKRLCGKCKLPAPFHSDYRAEDLNNPYKFSFFCHICVKKGKANVNDNPITCSKTDTEYSNHYRKKNAFNHKCHCGKIIRINEKAKTDDINLRKHIESNYHRIWYMLKEQQDCSNIDYKNDLIDFSLFSVGQLRHIIKTNLNEKKKPIIPSYSHKNKTELIKALKDNKDKIVISFDVLDIQKDKYDKKAKVLGIVYPDLQSEDDEEEYHYSSSSSSSSEEEESSSDEDSD
jgi:hypothetical protein